MNRREWNGRAVTFAEFSIKEGRLVREAFKSDGENASYLALALSLRYADDDAPVFQSADEVWAQPNRLQQRIIVLAGEAMTVNGLMKADTDGTAKPNGHDEEPAPGPSP